MVVYFTEYPVERIHDSIQTPIIILCIVHTHVHTAYSYGTYVAFEGDQVVQRHALFVHRAGACLVDVLFDERFLKHMSSLGTDNRLSGDLARN